MTTLNTKQSLIVVIFNAFYFFCIFGNNQDPFKLNGHGNRKIR